MLINSTTSGLVSYPFLIPYFIQTDSKGIVFDVCEKFDEPLSCLHIQDPNGHPVLTLFSSIADPVPSLTKGIGIGGFPDCIDIHPKHTITLAQERERAGTGRELHHMVGQILSTCKQYLERARSNTKKRMSLMDLPAMNIRIAVNVFRNISRKLLPGAWGAKVWPLASMTRKSS